MIFRSSKQQTNRQHQQLQQQTKVYANMEATSDRPTCNKWALHRCKFRGRADKTNNNNNKKPISTTTRRRRRSTSDQAHEFLSNTSSFRRFAPVLWCWLLLLAYLTTSARGASTAAGSVPFKTSFVSSSDYSIRRNGALTLNSMAQSSEAGQQQAADSLIEMLVNGEGPSIGDHSSADNAMDPNMAESAAATGFGGLLRSGDSGAVAANYFSTGDHLISSSMHQHQQPAHEDPLLAASSQLINTDNSTTTTTTTTTSTPTTAQPASSSESPLTTTTSTAAPTQAKSSTTTAAPQNATQPALVVETITTKASPPPELSAYPTTTEAPTSSPTTPPATSQPVEANKTTEANVSAPTPTPTTTTTTTTSATQAARESRKNSEAPEQSAEEQLKSTTKTPRFGYLSQSRTQPPADQEPVAPLFSSNRNTASLQQQQARHSTTTQTFSRPCKELGDAKCGNFIVASVPVLTAQSGNSSSANNSTSLVNEFVFVPEDSGPLNLDESAYSNTTTTSKPATGTGNTSSSSSEPQVADLKAEHRSIEADGDSSLDVELDYVSSNDDDKQRTPSVTLKPALPSTTTTTTSRPIITTRAATTTTTTTTTSLRPKLTDVGARTSQSSSYSVRVSSSSSSSSLPKVIITTKRPTSTPSTSPPLEQQTSRSKPTRENQKLMRESSTQTELSQLTALSATNATSTTASLTSSTSLSATPTTSTSSPMSQSSTTTTTTSRQPNEGQQRSTNSANARPTSQRRPKANSYRKFFNEPIEGDWQRRQRPTQQGQQPQTSGTSIYSPVNNGADEEEANILTRYQIPSQLARLSSRSLNATAASNWNYNNGSTRQQQVNTSSSRPTSRGVASWNVASTSPRKFDQDMDVATYGAAAPARGRQQIQQSRSTAINNRRQPSRESQQQQVSSSSSTTTTTTTTSQMPTISPVVDGSEAFTVSFGLGEPSDDQQAANVSQLLQQALNGELMTLISSSVSGHQDKSPLTSSALVVVQDRVSPSTTTTTTTSQPETTTTGRSTTTSTSITSSTSASSTPSTTTTTTTTTSASNKLAQLRQRSEDFAGSLEEQLAQEALHGGGGGRRAASRHQANTYSSIEQSSRPLRRQASSSSTTLRPAAASRWPNDGMWQPDTNDVQDYPGGVVASSTEARQQQQQQQQAVNSSGQPQANSNNNQLPGRPGVDYPVHWQPPKTSFDCLNYELAGFYADVESDCQAYHSCHRGRGGRHTFLCPNGTLFSQELLTCDWWYNVECSGSKLSHLQQQQQANNNNDNNDNNDDHDSSRTTAADKQAQ